MNFQPTQQQVSSIVLAALTIRSTIDEKLACSKTNTAAQQGFDCVAKSMTHNRNNFGSATQNCGDDPMSKYRKAVEKVVDVTSTNRSFRTMRHAVGTYEQTKKKLFYFFLRRSDQQDGIHTRPVNM